MNLRPEFRVDRSQGHALIVVLGFLVVGLITLGGSLQWLSTNARLIERNNQYFTALAAAEAASEKAISEMAADYQRYGAAHMVERLDDYALRVPLVSEYAGWESYRFMDAGGQENAITVQQTQPWGVTGLISQYAGLSGYAASNSPLRDSMSTI